MGAPKGHPPYNKNGEGGRPVIWTDEAIDKEADALEEWMQDENNLFIKEFCAKRGYHSVAYQDFIKKSKRFSLIYMRAKELQELKLLKGAVHGKYKENITKFALINHHNYKEKTESDIRQDTTITVRTISYNDADKPIEIEAKETHELTDQSDG